MCDRENKKIIMHICERERLGERERIKKKEKEKMHIVEMFKIVTEM